MKTLHKNSQLDDFQAETLIVRNNASKSSLELAMTSRYIGFEDENRASVITALKCNPAIYDDREAFGPVFYKVGGFVDDGSFQLSYILYFGAKILFCRDIDVSENHINFKLAEIYKLKTKQHICPSCSYKQSEWVIAKKAEDIVLNLDREIISIQAVNDHWDYLFCFGADKVLRMREAMSAASLGFKKVEKICMCVIG